MRPVILGGTFNPIHNGHITLAREVLKMGYDTILFTPALLPVHKKSPVETTTPQRIEMVKLAIQDQTNMEISLCEIERGGASYSIDTVREINKTYNISRCGLVVGDDQAAIFDSWREPYALAAEAEILVAHRTSKKELNLPFPHRYINNTIVKISSTQLREEFSDNNQSETDLIPPKVMEYIRRHGLYRKK